MKSFKEYLIETELMEEVPHTGDVFEIEIAREEIVLESVVVDFADDGIIIEADETMLKILKHVGYITESPDVMSRTDDSTSPIHGGNNDEDYPGSRGVWMHGGYKIRYNPETFTLTVQGKNQERRHRWNGKPTKQAYRIAVQQLIDKLEDETEMYEAGEPPVDYPHSGTGVSPDMQSAVDIARMKAKTNLLRSIHGDTFQDKPMPDYEEDKVQLVPGQKPGTYQATVRMRQRQSQPQPTNEAKYHGREVPLGKKMKGDVKKSKVYVRKPNGNIVKVEFGDPNMRIKKSNPKRRKSFRARHNCQNPGPRWKARYWSCRAW